MRLCPDSVVAWGKKKAEELQVVAARICDSWLELACAMSTKRAFASPARPLAAYRLDGRPDLVSGVGQARRVAQGLSRRGGRPRSLQTLLRAARRQARAVQRPSLARTQGPDRHRQRAMGRANARPLVEANAAVRSAHVEGALSRALPDARSANVDQTLQRHRPGRGSAAPHRNLPPLPRPIRSPRQGLPIARDTIS